MLRKNTIAPVVIAALLFMTSLVSPVVSASDIGIPPESAVSGSTTEAPEGTMNTPVDLSSSSLSTSSTSSTSKESEPPPVQYNITEVFSVNNTLSYGFYKPKLADVPNLEGRILEEGSFASAYMGFFDNNHSDPYKPAGSASRDLEVLGYDFLIYNDSYADDAYVYNLVDTNPRRDVTIMNIMRAMDINLFDYTIISKKPDKGDVSDGETPAVGGLPTDGTVTSRARTDVFVSRSNVALYIEKASKDFGIADVSNDTSIQFSEFMVLCANMMEFYGEPVIGDIEMKQLLQVYGYELPQYLSDTEKQAFLYLKARGVLNIKVDYTASLNLIDMLNILMCIKDRDSRTNFKEVQLVYDVSDEFVEAGYFGNTVSLNDGTSAASYTSSIDYSVAHSYDYYIQSSADADFIHEDGTPSRSLYVPDKGSGKPFVDSYYDGLVNGYHHFIVPIKYGTGTITISSTNKDDMPKEWRVPSGGGIYTLASSSSGIVTFTRTPFGSHEYEWSSSVERKNPTSQVASVVVAINPFTPLTVYAAAPGTTTGAGVATMIQGNNTTSAAGTKINGNNTSLRSTGEAATSLEIRANISGDILVKFADIVAHFNKNGFDISEPVITGSVLSFATPAGEISVDNTKRIIIVGNSIYRLPISGPEALFRKDKEGVWVDYRAFYGWTSDRLSFVITIDDKTADVVVNVKQGGILKGGSRHALNVKTPFSLITRSGVYEENAAVYKKDGVAYLALDTSYPLANWITVHFPDEKTGATRTSLFVFSLKAAYGANHLPTDSSAKFKDITGYTVSNANWVVKEYDISASAGSNFGGAVGSISRVEGIGYVYKLPSELKISEYHSSTGSMALPMYMPKITGNPISVVCDYYEGLDYGLIPFGKNVYNYDGMLQLAATISNGGTVRKFIPYPVGIAAYLNPRPAKMSSVAKINYESTHIYFGTMPKCDDKISHVAAGGSDAYNQQFEGLGTDMLKVGQYTRQGNVTEIFIVTSEQGALSYNKEDVKSTVDIQPGNKVRTFSGFDDLSLRFLLGALDRGMTWVILFTLYVIPLVLVIFATLVFAFVLMKDNKLFIMFVNRFFDPIKILTFGKQEYSSFGRGNVLIRLVVVYVALLSVLGGNFIKLISWVLELYTAIIH